jgi:RNA polymerase sigma-70 factor (sigma-E family)
MALLSDATAQREFDRFVATSTADLLRAGYLLTWNLAEAEDLTQETFLRTARRWNAVRKMEHPKAYARQVLFHLAIRENGRRTKTRPTPNGGESLDVTVDERFERRIQSIDTRSDIETALAQLPLRQRAVIVLRYFEDLTEIEIADALGWPVGTVKSTASRALDALRHSIDSPAARLNEPLFKSVPSNQGVHNEQSA